MALFHDRFIDLRKELRQVLTSMKVRVINGYGCYSLLIINNLYGWSFRFSPIFPLYGFTFKTTCTSYKQTTEYVNMMVTFRENGFFKSFYEGQLSFFLFTNNCICSISGQCWLKTGYELYLLGLRSEACIPLAYVCPAFTTHVCTCCFKHVKRSHQMSRHTSPITKTSLSKQHRFGWK